MRNKALRILGIFGLSLILCACGQGDRKEEPQYEAGGSSYQTLLDLFREFRDFEQPPFLDGVPDYSAAAMSEKELRIPEFKRRLEAIDTSDWPISQKVDYEIVRAEMNGWEFDHRVLRPWARDPSFYAVITTSESDVPAREGPEIAGVLDVWRYSFPLDEKKKEEFRLKLEAIPGILVRAEANLVEAGRDLCFFGIRQKRNEVGALERLGERFSGIHPDLVPAVREAGAAVSEFLSRLEEKYEAMAPTADGIGVEEFDWYMKNVHLVPYTWEEQMDILNRELERSWTALGLEELRNSGLPPLEPPATLEKLQERVRTGVAEFMDFLRNKPVFTVPEYMHLDDGARSLAPPERRDFFTQVSYHDQLPLLCHQVHWLEKQRESRNPHPIRGVPLLYNIWDSRAEGFATGFEETLLQAGLLDKNPRSRELTWILLAFRAARAMGDLKLHSREWTLQEAVDFAVANTPRGWALPEGRTIWGDMGLYLRQPGYGTSYVYGKIQFEKLLAERAIRRGDDFRLKDFLDEYFSHGLIPASLIRWEMMGFEDEMKALGR